MKKILLTIILLYLPAINLFAHGISEKSLEIIHLDDFHYFTDFFIRPVYSAVNIQIDNSSGYRIIKSDGIPNHSTGNFPNRNNPNSISAQDYNFRVTLNPKKSNRVTEIGHNYFGVALNGVPFDPATAEFWNNDRNSKWVLDAIKGGRNLGLDQNNAHVQPNGAYHYHSLPIGLIQNQNYKNKPVLIGYAADGFPIYTPYAHTNSQGDTIELTSSYKVKQGNRSDGPSGQYDGRYTLDYEYVDGLGDLDQCNGRISKTDEYPNGTYHYVISNQYPFIPRCWSGSPDSSFQIRRGSIPRQGSNGRDDAMPPRLERSERPGRNPPREAISACNRKSNGSRCVVNRPHGELNGTCRNIADELACVPARH